jgi:hypothetical protein
MYLSNGEDPVSFAMTAWFAPVMVCFIVMIYTFRGVGRRDGSRPKWGGWFFWVVVVYFCLPIILNGSSILLKLVGYDMVSHYLFENRFRSLFAVLALLLAYAVVTHIASGIRRWFSGETSP